MTEVLIVTMRSMLVFITFKLTTLKNKNKCFYGCYFEKHYSVIFINRRERTLLGELLLLMVMHTVENDIKQLNRVQELVHWPVLSTTLQIGYGKK